METKYKERILRIAERIKEAENMPSTFFEAGIHYRNDIFSMKQIAHKCGTPSCIAGYILNDKCQNEFKTDSMEISEESINNARLWIGITENQSDKLFVPRNEFWQWQAKPSDSTFITAERASQVLKHLAETEEVNWFAGMSEKEIKEHKKAVTTEEITNGS